MKKIVFFLGFALLVTSGIFAQDALFDEIIIPLVTTFPIVTIIVAIGHICITFAIYKSKGGAWALAYFFLAPLVILVLVLGLSGAGGVKSNRKDIHHHFK